VIVESFTRRAQRGAGRASECLKLPFVTRCEVDHVMSEQTCHPAASTEHTREARTSGTLNNPCQGGVHNSGWSATLENE
jgi:hypothetical protein